MGDSGVGFQRLVAEEDKADLVERISAGEETVNLIDRDVGREVERIAVSAGADRRKGDGADAKLGFGCQGKSVSIATCEQFVFVGPATLPNRTNRMDDPFRR